MVAQATGTHSLKLAVSCSGEGFGHCTRIIALMSELQHHATLFFWCPHTVKSEIQNAFPHRPVADVPFMKLIKTNHRVRPILTALQNIKTSLSWPFHIWKIARRLKEENIQAVIVDYEPVLALAARLAKRPIIAFNHQGIIYKYSARSKTAIEARIANKFMMPTYDYLIVSSFYNGDVGPILRQKVKDKVPKNGNTIVVYLKDSFKSTILPLLEKYPHVAFDCFPSPEKDLVDALAHCKAVISPAGHQLLSEALYFKKPILAVPESAQYEQILNATLLEKSGRGMMSTTKELPKKLETFLSQLDQFPKSQHGNNRFMFEDDTKNAIDKILEILKKGY